MTSDEDGPERTCIVTRAKDSPEGLMRFVLGPGDVVVPDLRCKLPGRGAWVTARHEVVAEAVRRRAFARAFRKPVETPPDLAEMVDGLLEKDALQALSLANKAGLVVAGAAKIEGSFAATGPAALIHASDGRADGIRKLEAALRRRIGDAADAVTRVRIFRSEQLDLVLGRTNVVHAAVAGGSAGAGFVSRATRLARYRTGAQAGEAAAAP